MPNTPETGDMQHPALRSRRKLFKWAGQITMGAALAGLGIGLSQPAYACTQFCKGCTVNTCQLSGTCAHAGQGSYFITYTYKAGCEPNCQTLHGSSCSFSCHC